MEPQELGKAATIQALRITEGISNRQLAQVLRSAGVDAEKIVLSMLDKPGIGAATRRAQLTIAQQQLRTLSSKLWNTVGDATRQGMFEAARLAMDHSYDLDALTGMPVAAILGYAEGMDRDAIKAAQTIVTRHSFGFQLSERVYMNDVATVNRVGRIIDESLAMGRSAKEIAAEVRGFISPDTPGGVSYAAMRLARTEINNAYHDTVKEKMKKRPWVEGIDWNLSGSHPRHDICDEYAEKSPWDKAEVPSKPHPQCLCYITAALPSNEKFIDNLFEGKYNGWLKEQGLHHEFGVDDLGKWAAMASTPQLDDLVRKMKGEGASWKAIAKVAKEQGLVDVENPARIKRIAEKLDAGDVVKKKPVVEAPTKAPEIPDSLPQWKPRMTPPEIEIWSKGSYYGDQTLYHFTTKADVVESIGKEGFRVSDGIYGKGIYLTPERSGEGLGLGFSSVRVPVATRLMNPLEVDGFPGLNKWMKAYGGDLEPREALLKRGYDGLIAHQTDGPDYILAFTREQLVLVDEVKPSYADLLKKVADTGGTGLSKQESDWLMKYVSEQVAKSNEFTKVLKDKGWDTDLIGDFSDIPTKRIENAVRLVDESLDDFFDNFDFPGLDLTDRPKVQFYSNGIPGLPKAKQVRAAFNSTNNTLAIDLRSTAWDSLAGDLGSWTSTSSPFHTVRHELGHWLNVKKIGLERAHEYQKWAPGQKKDLYGFFPSEYASYSPEEFMAEVFAALCESGEQGLDEVVMGFYRHLGGVVPKRRAATKASEVIEDAQKLRKLSDVDDPDLLDEIAEMTFCESKKYDTLDGAIHNVREFYHVDLTPEEAIKLRHRLFEKDPDLGPYKPFPGEKKFLGKNGWKYLVDEDEKKLAKIRRAKARKLEAANKITKEDINLLNIKVKAGIHDTKQLADAIGRPELESVMKDWLKYRHPDVFDKLSKQVVEEVIEEAPKLKPQFMGKVIDADSDHLDWLIETKGMKQPEDLLKYLGWEKKYSVEDMNEWFKWHHPELWESSVKPVTPVKVIGHKVKLKKNQQLTPQQKGNLGWAWNNENKHDLQDLLDYIISQKADAPNPDAFNLDNIYRWVMDEHPTYKNHPDVIKHTNELSEGVLSEYAPIVKGDIPDAVINASTSVQKTIGFDDIDTLEAHWFTKDQVVAMDQAILTNKPSGPKSLASLINKTGQSKFPDGPSAQEVIKKWMMRKFPEHYEKVVGELPDEYWLTMTKDEAKAWLIRGNKQGFHAVDQFWDVYQKGGDLVMGEDFMDPIEWVWTKAGQYSGMGLKQKRAMYRYLGVEIDDLSKIKLDLDVPEPTVKIDLTPPEPKPEPPKPVEVPEVPKKVDKGKKIDDVFEEVDALEVKLPSGAMPKDPVLLPDGGYKWSYKWKISHNYSHYTQGKYQGQTQKEFIKLHPWENLDVDNPQVQLLDKYWVEVAHDIDDCIAANQKFESFVAKWFGGKGFDDLGADEIKMIRTAWVRRLKEIKAEKRKAARAARGKGKAPAEKPEIDPTKVDLIKGVDDDIKKLLDEYYKTEAPGNFDSYYALKYLRNRGIDVDDSYLRRRQVDVYKKWMDDQQELFKAWARKNADLTPDTFSIKAPPRGNQTKAKRWFKEGNPTAVDAKKSIQKALHDEVYGKMPAADVVKFYEDIIGELKKAKGIYHNVSHGVDDGVKFSEVMGNNDYCMVINSVSGEMVHKGPKDLREMLGDLLHGRTLDDALEEYSRRHYNIKLVPMDRIDEINEAIGMQLSRDCVATWAATSSNNHPLSLLVQRAVAKEFDLSTVERLSTVSDEAKAALDALWDLHEAEIRRFVRGMYDHTQRELEEAGVEYVELWRGMNLHGPEWNDITPTGTIKDRLPLQPCSSFSLSKSVARRFGKHLTKVTVPRSRVLGTARTGFGCLNEQEWVILDTEGNVMMFH